MNSFVLSLALLALADASPDAFIGGGLAATSPREYGGELSRGEDPPIVRGEQGQPSPSEALSVGATSLSEERARAALERGLAWLASQQAVEQDGSFPKAGGKQYVPVPVAALAALAFMSAGSSPDRGPYGRNVSLAIDYLAQRADLTPGSATFGYIASEGDQLSRMHGHGYAALALAQAYSMSPRTTRGKRVAEVLRAATQLIEKCQGVEGGWFYEPRSTYEHENSVTVCLVQALRGAKNAGIEVDAGVISRAIDYVCRCQADDGSFRYGLGLPQTSIALTAAGITTLNAAGRYEDMSVDRAMEALWQRLGLREEGIADKPSAFPFYERFYLAQALWQQQDRRLFERWVGRESTAVLEAQRSDGSWEDEQFGSCYATAMNCLFLALPESVLPIFQR